MARSRGEYAPGDLNESLMIGPVDVGESDYYSSPAAGKHFYPNLWPERPADLRQVYTTYYRVMSDLCCTMMRLFALALDQPETCFDDRIDKHISRLRVRNYPAPAVPPQPGQLRAGAHSDYGSLTILKTEDNQEGYRCIRRPDLGRRSHRARLLCGEPRRSHGTLDDRPLGVHLAPCGESAHRRGVHEPSTVVGVFPQSELRCRDRVYSDLPGARQSAKYPVTTSGEHLRSQFVRTQTE